MVDFEITSVAKDLNANKYSVELLFPRDIDVESEMRQLLQSKRESAESMYNSFLAKLNEQSAKRKEEKLKMTDELVHKIYKEPSPNEFVRSESLTYAESQKADAWMKQHEKDFHSEDKKVYCGASPVSKYYTKISYCSISSWIECVCSKCEDKYKNVIRELDELEDEANKQMQVFDVEEQRKLKKTRDKRRKALEREKDKLYKQAYFEIRGIDE